MIDAHSIYIHIPFCRHRCSYCDFNTYAGQDGLRPAYVRALVEEIRMVGSLPDERIPAHTIFFGGGTPSLLTCIEIEAILSEIHRWFNIQEGAEISLEANPGTISPGYLRDLRRLGVNRLSMGAQSAHPDDLRLLERQHDYPDVIQSVSWARRAGFENISLDLIFGLPEQPLERWIQTIESVIRLDVEHLSLYALGIESGTPFKTWLDKGLIPVPDDDTAADMYEFAAGRLARASFEQYEISNWARQDASGSLQACLHNLQYWRALPYLGFGAGAHGYAGGRRTANIAGIAAYIRRIDEGGRLELPASPAAETVTLVDRWTEMEELMMVGLRLTEEGVSTARFEDRFGVPLASVFSQQIRKLSAAGLLELAGGDSPRLRLTRRGRLLGNQVFMQFVGNPPSGAGETEPGKPIQQ